jgi:hypothetical protein
MAGSRPRLPFYLEIIAITQDQAGVVAGEIQEAVTVSVVKPAALAPDKKLRIGLEVNGAARVASRQIVLGFQVQPVRL